MKKTDFNKYHTFAANVAEGLEFDEAEKMQKTSAKTRKFEQNKAWLKSQEAELATLTAQTNEALGNTLESTQKVADKVKNFRIGTKRDLHQVFTLTKDNVYARVA